MKRFLLLIFCLLAFPVLASHIVGGEFEIVHISGFRYKVNLIVYFDEVNGLPGNKEQDQFITARIYRFSDNAFIDAVTLKLTTDTPVKYTQPDCSIGELKTSRMFYTTEMTMSPERYGDPGGYYIVWERCCRNYTISNIYSANPQTTPGQAAGQTFYLHFPPVVKNGLPFVNSSPVLFPPLSDYACINKPYYADFAGSDRDGDSLVYSLVTPFSTHTADAYPPINPAPYPVVQWRPPFGPNNILNGDPDLKISKDGLLTVTPRFLEGLFVFAVKCEEFRNGVKIGEVRRDFQMLVTDCQTAIPPKITAKQSDGTFSDGALNAFFPNTTPDSERCITVRVEDSDALDVLHGQSERVNIRAIPIGFEGDVSDVIPTLSSATLSPTKPFVDFKVCFDKCPHKEGLYQIGIIAEDDACALPLLDTIKINVMIQPPPNERPRFETPTADVFETVKKGFERVWPIRGIDPDGRGVTLEVVPKGFNLQQAGFTYRELSNANGKVEAELVWNTNCEIYDFRNKRSFEILMLLDDEDECDLKEPDTLVFNLNVDLELGRAPIVGANLTPLQLRDGIEAKIFQSLDFVVHARDDDKDYLTLALQGDGFNPADYNAQFPGAAGPPVITSPFTWMLNCDKIDLTKKDTYDLLFIATENKTVCQITQGDTLRVKVKVLKPDNLAPTLNVTNLSADAVFENNKLSTILGKPITLNLLAQDADQDPRDKIKIELIKAEGNVEPSGYQFTTTEGESPLEAVFTWNPDCEIFENKIYENDYTFTFRAGDNRCFNQLADTVAVNINIKDVDGSDLEFLPPNIITPNGDGCNDYFAMEGTNEGLNESGCTEVLAPNLPKDNCAGKFSSIRIVNRWGKEVFQSSKRDFKWLATDATAGVYFYTIVYTTAEYKGTVTVRF